MRSSLPLKEQSEGRATLHRRAVLHVRQDHTLDSALDTHHVAARAPETSARLTKVRLELDAPSTQLYPPKLTPFALSTP